MSNQGPHNEDAGITEMEVWVLGPQPTATWPALTGNWSEGDKWSGSTPDVAFGGATAFLDTGLGGRTGGVSATCSTWVR